MDSHGLNPCVQQFIRFTIEHRSRSLALFFTIIDLNHQTSKYVLNTRRAFVVAFVVAFLFLFSFSKCSHAEQCTKECSLWFLSCISSLYWTNDEHQFTSHNYHFAFTIMYACVCVCVRWISHLNSSWALEICAHSIRAIWLLCIWLFIF